MRRLWLLLLPLLLLTAACERGEVRDTDGAGTGVAPDRSGDGPAAEAGLPETDPAPDGAAPNMQTTPGRDRTPEGAIVIDGTVRRDAQGRWTFDTARETFLLEGLPADFQRDGLRTRARLEFAKTDSTNGGNQSITARVVEIGDVL